MKLLSAFATGAIALASVLGLTTGGAAPTITDTGMASASPPIALGTTVDGGPDMATALDSYATLVGHRPAIAMWFQSWSEPLFYSNQLPIVSDRGEMPMVSWEPVLTGGTRVPLAEIASGAYDSYLTSAADAAAAWDGPLLVRFDYEMNLYPGQGSPAEFIAAWRHVVTVFRQQGATNVQWVWSPNVDCAGTCPFSAYYPGDQWVDWVGLDGYNYASVDDVPWMSLDQVFSQSYNALTSLTEKPVMIAETASTEVGGDKAAWITQGLLTTVPTLMPRVRAVVWFNEDAETDWRVNSSPSSLAAFRQVVASPLYGGTEATVLADSGGGSVSSPSSVTRVAGQDRVATAVAVAKMGFGPGSAHAVVLARDDEFADALSGGPLAAQIGGPLLLTPSGSLSPTTAAEIEDVLPKGRDVYLLGGTDALSPAIARSLASMGYVPVRLAGENRYDTAAAVAAAVSAPKAVLLSTGTIFPDAISAGAAAAYLHGVVLLTDGASLPQATRSWLTLHPGLPVYAVGGPAAAADPAAVPVMGHDRYGTAVAVAQRFFPDATGACIASGVNFPDALAADPVLGNRGEPVLLSEPDALPATDTAWLAGSQVRSVTIVGGPLALGGLVAKAAAAALP